MQMLFLANTCAVASSPMVNVVGHWLQQVSHDCPVEISAWEGSLLKESPKKPVEWLKNGHLHCRRNEQVVSVWVIVHL